MPRRVVKAQDRLELGSCLGKRPEVHGRDSGQAVAGKADKRAWKALRYLPSLVGQLPHHGIIAAYEVIDELTAEGRDERLGLAETFAKRACTAVGGACLWRGITVYGDQGSTDRDLKSEFLPISLEIFR